jgi:hypothetical protein
MTKPADDKLGHAKREIKALRLQFKQGVEHIERLELWRAEDKKQYKMLEALTDGGALQNALANDRIYNLEVLAAELTEALNKLVAMANRQKDFNDDRDGRQLDRCIKALGRAGDIL